MRLVLVGPQGAGKGTQAQRLAAITGARHIATGDLVRAEIQAGTALGRTIQDYNNRGELVPDAIIVAMVTPHLLSTDRWILDGFPRNQVQAMALDRALAAAHTGLDGVIALDAPDDALVERLSGRRQSAATGRTYHLRYNPPPVDDPGPFVQRDDDRPEAIRRRLQIYHAETEPLTCYYAALGLLIAVDALQPIDAVTGAILAALHESWGHRTPATPALPLPPMALASRRPHHRVSAR